MVFVAYMHKLINLLTARVQMRVSWSHMRKHSHGYFYSGREIVEVLGSELRSLVEDNNE